MLPWQCGHGRSVDWAAVTENLLKSGVGARQLTRGPVDSIFELISAGLPSRGKLHPRWAGIRSIFTVVKSALSAVSGRCPLYPQKHTSFTTIVMSALCQKPTSIIFGAPWHVRSSEGHMYN